MQCLKLNKLDVAKTEMQVIEPKTIGRIASCINIMPIAAQCKLQTSTMS
jgi:hypothetical protein